MPDEIKAAAELKVKIDELKINCFNYMISVSGMRADALKSSGHKSVDAAIVWAFGHYHKQIVNLSHAFLKEYPD